MTDTTADEAVQCGGEFERGISQVRAGLKEMMTLWENQVHSIVGPGNELYHTPHSPEYVEFDDIEHEAFTPHISSVKEFGQYSSKCACSRGLTSSQRIDRMFKVRENVEDVATYRLGVGVKPMQVYELAVMGRDDNAKAVPIIQVLSGNRIVVNAREMFGVSGVDAPLSFSMFLRGETPVRFVIAGKYVVPVKHVQA